MIAMVAWVRQHNQVVDVDEPAGRPARAAAGTWRRWLNVGRRRPGRHQGGRHRAARGRPHPLA